MFPEVNFDHVVVGYRRQMIVYVFNVLVRTHEGRIKAMYPRASLATKIELDDVKLVLITSSLGEGAVVRCVIDEPFFFGGSRSMMLDVVVVEEEPKENCVKLFVLALIQMHRVLRASEFHTEAEVGRVFFFMSAGEGNLNVFVILLLEVANGDDTFV